MLFINGPEFKKYEPILREKFRILERELITDDMKLVTPQNIKIAPQTYSSKQKRRQGIEETSTAADLSPISIIDEFSEQNTPRERLMSDELVDAEDFPQRNRTESRESHTTIVKQERSAMKRMEQELRSLSASLSNLIRSLEGNHQVLTNVFRRSATYISLPFIFSRRALLFMLLWPIVVHWLIRNYRFFSYV